jgi:hypothetical protein
MSSRLTALDIPGDCDPLQVLPSDRAGHPSPGPVATFGP